MDLGNLITGRLPLNLPLVYEGLFLNTPKHIDYMKTVSFMARYKTVAKESLLTLESMLPDDFYDIKQEAEKERRKVVLTLSEGDTPDERFIHSQEELNTMSSEELETYQKYLSKQYTAMTDALEMIPVYRKWQVYKFLRECAYKKTKEYELARIQKETLFAVTSTKEDGTPYFTSIEDGVAKLEELSEELFARVLETFDSVYTGESPSFF